MTTGAIIMLVVMGLMAVTVCVGCVGHDIDQRRKERKVETWTAKATLDKEAAAKV